MRKTNWLEGDTLMNNLKTILACCALAVPFLVGCDDDDDDLLPDAGFDAGIDAPSSPDGARDGAGGSPGMDAATDGGADAGGDALVAMPLGPNNRPMTLGTQIDRVGRPAISTATVATFEANMAAKDAKKNAYNGAAPAMWTSFAGDIETSLAILDSLDGTCGNQLAADQTSNRYNFLAGVLADDQLYVNSMATECGVYLGLEAEVLGVVQAGEGKCGGRVPMDDVIDRSYSVLAVGALMGVTDGVPMDAETHSVANFPFLAAP